jgi:hypothetical protein
MIGIDECIEPNSYVLTISIDTHAAVINVNLNDEENEIFKNVRYYSQVGEYYYSISNVNNDVYNYRNLKNIFRKTLYEPTYIEMENLGKTLKPIYKQMLEGYNVYDERRYEKSCKIHNMVVYDKVLSKFERLNDRYNQLYCYFNPSDAYIGIKLISLHKNTSNAVDGIKYQLVTPDDIDLSTLSGLIKLSVLINGKDVVSQVIQEKLRAPQVKDNEEILVNGDSIDVIRMSFFVSLIKLIFNNNCSINLIDFSCSHIYSKVSIPKEEKDRAMGYALVDIEAPPSTVGKFGGKKNKKHKKRTKNVKKFKKSKTKKLKKYNKTKNT